jgi:hypothetical protein
VFAPGLAERLFPQKVREDPMLLDEPRRGLSDRLARQGDRAAHERLLLRLAAGAATERLYLSYPRLETMQSRAWVPSFYALEVARAVTGRIPDHEQLEHQAALAAWACLAGSPSPIWRRRLRARPGRAARLFRASAARSPITCCTNDCLGAR